jgi:hypothetical protein
MTLYGGLCGGSDWIEPIGPWYMSISSEPSGEHLSAILFSCFVTIRRHFARAFWNQTCRQKIHFGDLCIAATPAKLAPHKKQRQQFANFTNFSITARTNSSRLPELRGGSFARFLFTFRAFCGHVRAREPRIAFRCADFICN